GVRSPEMRLLPSSRSWTPWHLVRRRGARAPFDEGWFEGVLDGAGGFVVKLGQQQACGVEPDAHAVIVDGGQVDQARLRQRRIVITDHRQPAGDLQAQLACGAERTD